MSETLYNIGKRIRAQEAEKIMERRWNPGENDTEITLPNLRKIQVRRIEVQLASLELERQRLDKQMRRILR